MKNTLTRSEQDEHGTWWYIQPKGTRQRAVVKLCPTCAERFLGYPNAGSAYCSAKCYRKKCIRCSLEFHPVSVRQTYCSEACKRGKYVCNNCSMEFVKGKKAKGLFCSKPCFYDYQCPVGTVVPYSNGYMLVKVPQGTPGSKKYGTRSTEWMIEHRYVMQRTLGRPLGANENVHHINGKRDDNRPENLELWKKSQSCGVRSADYHCAGCACFRLPVG